VPIGAVGRGEDLKRQIEDLLGQSRGKLILDILVVVDMGLLL
jgi:hypothetical protein